MTTTTNKKVVLRKDVVSRQMMAKDQLIRITKLKNSTVVVDWNQNLEGRGVYIQKDCQAVKKAQKINALNRGLRTHVDGQIYEELISGLEI